MAHLPSTSLHAYTIAWVSAVKEELVCASYMLDEEFPGPTTLPRGDDNAYIFGRVGAHYVVLACLPAGRYGVISACRTGIHLQRTFPNLQVALLVGVGGGAPSPRNDIRLGDVVVSQPVNGFGGVVEYDMGKILGNGLFQRTGHLNAPPKRVCAVLGEIQEWREGKLQERLGEHIRRMDIMGDDYARPPEGCDRLFRAEYEHVGGDECRGCDSRMALGRAPRGHGVSGGGPALKVHYGTIGCGNYVMKDAVLRDRYANDPEMGILCFEMEAAGLMNNIPCQVIRGICDYCDSHKNDEWRKYAALTAAAYARELLLVMGPLELQVEDAPAPFSGQSMDELEQFRQEVAAVADKQRILEKKLDAILQRLDCEDSSHVITPRPELHSDRKERYRADISEKTRTESEPRPFGVSERDGGSAVSRVFQRLLRPLRTLWY
ncbi:nucleoside phosphorylase domain-containing protein [Aspergillus egyptiacus]|nr:nucleoside phosphorylase domain-containing protein [Aspergillus egyptiacus]